MVLLTKCLSHVGASDFIFGAVATQYAGYVYGLRSDSSLNSDYSGLSVVGYIGISGSPIPPTDQIGPSFGFGQIGFVSASDLMIRGTATYVSFSLGLDPIPLIDGGIGVLNTIPVNRQESTSYLDRNDSTKVLRGELFNDIFLGKHNVWVSRLGLGYLSPIDWMSRTKAAIKAMNYATVYEELNQ